MESPPGIAALFVIRFDIRTGYVVSWKRTTSGVDVEGVVEYKSLPSGLHNVKDDLVYFVHDQYAGISSFLNQPAEEAERNAKMFAIGVLVPLSSGRLGKSWRHAPRLRDLTLKYAADMSNEQPLSDYWDAFHIGGPDTSAADSPVDSPVSLRFRPGDRPENLSRGRAFSDALVLETFRPALTPFHPASSLPNFIDSFGPLIFPLYRAALLRKRILFMTEAPHLSQIPLLQALPPGYIPPLRPRPLFNIGIHDIPYLSSFDTTRSNQDAETDPSWIACSTDTVLTMKPELEKESARKTYLLKATQRDARRYGMLRRGLRHFVADRSISPEAEHESDSDSTYSSSPVVEPISWTRLAYNSFIWWASAGEHRDGLSEEEEEHQIEQDARLLASVESLAYPVPNSTNRRSFQGEDGGQEPQEVALVAYFRRLTTQIFFTLAGAIARHDSESSDDDGTNPYHDSPYLDDPENDDSNLSLSMSRQSIHTDDDQAPLLRQRSNANHVYHTPDTQGRDGSCNEDPVTITIADMAEMGLDVWSATDRIFVEELVSLWWGRPAHVDSARIRCCGISIL
ncbi:hypothetical protein N7450_006271 [Penicillium hetheringtonii]|uniref:DUF4484 domain-containing protein n=1 Tax=Penicillium hetheringtonii TaxID=911720 RepID=A0AAD6DK40_9EURO|nr:hypothetical protein N7450_006271 [Penicillium hetheringtonii]